MALEILEAAASRLLVTAETAMLLPTYPAGLSSTILDMVVAGTAEAVWAHIRPSPRQRYSETVAGSGTTTVHLSAVPVEEIVSVTVNDVAVDVANVIIEDPLTGEINLGQSAPWLPMFHGRLEPIPLPRAHDERSVVIEYWAGWQLDPDDVDGVQVPPSVTLAALDSTRQALMDQRRDSSATSESRTMVGKDAGGWAVAYQSASGSSGQPVGTAAVLTPRALALLRPYRK